jgi:hypothetical protein
MIPNNKLFYFWQAENCFKEKTFPLFIKGALINISKQKQQKMRNSICRIILIVLTVILQEDLLCPPVQRTVF